MRMCALALALLAAPALGADDDKPPSRPWTEVKDVELTLSVPKEVRLTPARQREGPVATLTATITIKNTGDAPLTFGRYYLASVSFPPDNSQAITDPDHKHTGLPFLTHWDDGPRPRDKTVFTIPPGQTYKTTVQWSFLECPGQPRSGNQFYMMVKLFGQRCEQGFTFR
jgi:hypothetical protein